MSNLNQDTPTSAASGDVANGSRGVAGQPPSDFPASGGPANRGPDNAPDNVDSAPGNVGADSPGSADAGVGNQGVASAKPAALVSDADALRRQWESVQVGFVDDPRGAVREADALVSTAINDLATNFSEQRARLEAGWASDSGASTDDLRGAFQTYRDFFDRLLSV
jgi:hypothetical protein